MKGKRSKSARHCVDRRSNGMSQCLAFRGNAENRSNQSPFRFKLFDFDAADCVAEKEEETTLSASESTSESTEEELPSPFRNVDDTFLEMIRQKRDASEIAEWCPSASAPYYGYLIRAPRTSNANVPENVLGKPDKRSILERTLDRTDRGGGKRRSNRTLSVWQTHIGKGRNPIRKTRQHNKGELLSKSTRAGAPNWELVCFVGPFESKGQSMDFRQTWRKKRRTLDRRFDYLTSGEHKWFKAAGSFPEREINFYLNPDLSHDLVSSGNAKKHIESPHGDETMDLV